MFRKKVGIVCCSNGIKRTSAREIRDLEQALLNVGLCPVFSDFIYEKESVFSGTAKERAQALMSFYANDEITDIFDISGGDIANGILPCLDYEIIANSSKRLWGYSDLTTVLNAIYAKSRKPSVLYQIRNLIYENGRQQLADFSNVISEQGTALFRLNYTFLQQKEMRGIVVGGNLRCFLKLAGTEYMPDLTGKLLLLESYGGTVAKTEACLCQLQQLGAFDKAAGLILGTFTQMEAENCVPTVEMLVREMVRKDLPIVVTGDIGHGTAAKAIVIGQELQLKE